MHNAPQVRPHPQGGHTIAVPVPGTATARIYVGHFITPEAAARELARCRGRLEGAVALAQIRRAAA